MRAHALSTGLTMPADLDTRFELLGIAIVEYALSADEIASLQDSFAALTTNESLQAAACAPLLELARRLGGVDMRLDQVVAREPHAANLFARWHQDRQHPNRTRPAEALRRIVTLEVHLDPSGEDDGPLEVLPGSHRNGWLDRNAIANLAARTQPLVCLTARGDIVALRPLLVRRSQMARVMRGPRAEQAKPRVIELAFTPVSQLSA